MRRGTTPTMTPPYRIPRTPARHTAPEPVVMPDADLGTTDRVHRSGVAVPGRAWPSRADREWPSGAGRARGPGALFAGGEGAGTGAGGAWARAARLLWYSRQVSHTSAVSNTVRAVRPREKCTTMIW